MKPERSGHYFLLYACCFPVKGHQRSLICDTQRNDFIFIPNAMYELLTDCRGMSLEGTYAHYQGEYNQEIDEYFSFLIEKEYGFFTDTPALFPEMDLQFKEYAAINNAILDVGDKPAYDLQKVIAVLDELFCEAIQIRFLQTASYSQLVSVAGMLEGTGFSTVEFVILQGQPFSASAMTALIRKHPRVTRITLFNCLEEKEFEEVGRPVIFSTAVVDAINDCGCVSPHYFSTHIRHMSEARVFNTCLNKKLAIDVEGKIRNCPSMNPWPGRKPAVRRAIRC